MMTHAIAMFFGAVVFGLFISLVPISYHAQGLKAVTECEKNLPRNQHCQIVAIPKEQPNEQ